MYQYRFKVQLYISDYITSAFQHDFIRTHTCFTKLSDLPLETPGVLRSHAEHWISWRHEGVREKLWESTCRINLPLFLHQYVHVGLRPVFSHNPSKAIWPSWQLRIPLTGMLECPRGRAWWCAAPSSFGSPFGWVDRELSGSQIFSLRLWEMLGDFFGLNFVVIALGVEGCSRSIHVDWCPCQQWQVC